MDLKTNEDYVPYENREEHDFVNSLTVKIAKIHLDCSDLLKIVNKYLEEARQRRRSENETTIPKS